MKPTEREEILKRLIASLEEELTKANDGKRMNFILIIGENGGPDGMYVSHLSNTPKPLAMLMMKALYGTEVKSNEPV